MAVTNTLEGLHQTLISRCVLIFASLAGALYLPAHASDTSAAAPYRVQEARIAELHQAMQAGRLSAQELVTLYLQRIQAYDGSCVDEAEGVLGVIQTRADAARLNALLSLNLRPATLKAWGFSHRQARTQTDPIDADPALPDALETARALDAHLAATGTLSGPLHGIPIVIKDQYDTVDLRTTSGADADYANDRPPRDATVVARLRAAGAIILAKGNMGEYASGDRSSFAGPQCNPYDTERSAGRSSGGAAAAVAANLAVCAIGEESGPSVRNPARNNNLVGLAPTTGLVGRTGMVPATLFNDRVGPLCRTVEDTARVLDVIVGYDPEDELTAFAVGRTPGASYLSATQTPTLKGLRIGVLREYMDKSAFTVADHANIDGVEAQLPQLSALGATLVDPGAGGSLFAECIQEYLPINHPRQYEQLNAPRQSPPVRTAKEDQIASWLALRQAPANVSHALSLRDIQVERISGESRYALELYLQRRGDAKINSVATLLQHSRFYQDIRAGSGFSDRRQYLVDRLAEQRLGDSSRAQTQIAVQSIILQCMARHRLDALVYPTSNIPPPKLGAPVEPVVNQRSPLAWSVLGVYGFPAITVPAGFTREVYDRVADEQTPEGSRLIGPLPARLPVGIDFLARPFDESLLLRIAAAYEASTNHRQPPAGFP